MRSYIVRSSRNLLLSGFAALVGMALSGCADAPDTGEALGEAEQAATVCVQIQRGVGTSVVADSFLHQGSPAGVYGGPDMYSGIHSSGATQYSVLSFDLSAIPAGATIVSADVTVSIGSSNADVVNVHRMTAPWTESNASWNLLSTSWDSASYGSFTAGSYGNRTFSVASLVEEWIDGTHANYGMLLEQTSHRTQIKSSEASQTSRPSLVVCYKEDAGSAGSGDTSTSSTSGAGGADGSSTSSTTGAGGADGSSTSSTTGTGGTGTTGTISGVPGPAKSCNAEAQGAGHNCGVNHDDDCCASLPVTGGTFNRLNDASYPATVSSFYLDKYNITVGRFRQFIEQTGGPTQANPPAAGSGAHPKIANSGWDSSWNSMLAADTASLKTALVCADYGWADWSDTAGSKENKPIVCASWVELFAFCAWDGGRLPTQAEMNYASAGGDEQRLYPWVAASVNDITMSDASWCCQGDGSVAGSCISGYPSSSAYPCNPNDLTDVGSFPAGAGRWGQLDLAGNAYKATRDGSDNYNPLTPCNDCSRLDNTSSGRVMHGGSFLAAAYKQTTTYRAGYATDARRYYITATCARDL